jgi:O6-methylguanine-DNA--protein-cysteine methyltransferase
MKSTYEWVIVRIDGQIAAISTDYAALATITAKLAQQKSPAHKEITAVTVGFDEVWEIRKNAKWEDLLLFGTDFQKKVWRKLWDLTHPQESMDAETEEAESRAGKGAARLHSYSDFAGLCENRAGVRAVAHAIGLNPISVIIPCHLVVPKESIDRIREIQRRAESTIFKGEDLCLNSILEDTTIDFGEYSLGKELKRELIILDMA